MEDPKINEHAKEMFEDLSRNEYSQDEIVGGSSYQNRSEFENGNRGFCIFWNRGKCDYGISCKYLHEESPECRYQENCYRKESCRFFHSEFYGKTQSQPGHFLGRAQSKQNNI